MSDAQEDRRRSSAVRGVCSVSFCRFFSCSRRVAPAASATDIFINTPQANNHEFQFVGVPADVRALFLQIHSTFVDDPKTLEMTTTVSSPSGECEKNFVLVRQFRAWGLSGVNWWIYRRED